MNPTAVFNQYYHLLYSIALGFMKSKEDAEDIVQETFAKWLKQDHQKIENTKAYLVQSVKNTCYNYIEELRRKRNEVLTEWSDQFSEYQQHLELRYHDFEAEMSDRLAEMMRKLSPDEQTIFILRESFELSYEEISENIDTKITAARKTFQRAREKMQASKPRFELDKVMHNQTLPAFVNAHWRGEWNEYVQHMKKNAGDWIREKQREFKKLKK